MPSAATGTTGLPLVRIVRTEVEWDSLRDAWDGLYSEIANAPTPLDFHWLRQWWTTYSQALPEAALCIITLWRADALVGVLPLYERRERLGPFAVRCVGFLSTGEAEIEEICPDYLDLLCSVDEEAACANAAWHAIDGLAFDHLQLLDMPAGALLSSPAAPAEMSRLSRGTCLVADLSGGFDAYLSRLSANSRQNSRRLLREAERAGIQFQLADQAQASDVFDELIELHQVRWIADGKPGVFAAPRFVVFHRAMVDRWVRNGRIVLARMSLGAQPVAILYGFVSGNRFEFYQSGVHVDGSGLLRSPGSLAHLLLMRALAERGISAYDFLRGAAPYKARLTTSATELTELRLWRTNARSVLFRTARLTGRAVRKGWRFLGRRSA